MSRTSRLLPGALACVLAAGTAAAQTDVSPLYAIPGAPQAGKAPSAVILCPSADGSYTATSCQPTPMAPVASTQLETAHVLKASAGTLYSLTVTGAGGGVIAVLDAASVPPDGAVAPKLCFSSDGSGNQTFVSYPPTKFTVGVVVSFSNGANSTCFNKATGSSVFFSAAVQ